MHVAPEYRDQVHAQLHRLGVPACMVEVDVQFVGNAQDGRPLYIVLLKITQWEKMPALRLLLAHGLLEAGVRRAVMSSWLADVSHFAGVWVRLSTRLQGGQAALDLRRLLKQLADEEAVTEVPARSPAARDAVPGSQVRAPRPGSLQ